MTQQEELRAAALLAESTLEALGEAGLPHAVVLVFCSSDENQPATLAAAMSKQMHGIGHHMLLTVERAMKDAGTDDLGFDPTLN